MAAFPEGQRGVLAALIGVVNDIGRAPLLEGTVRLVPGAVPPTGEWLTAETHFEVVGGTVSGIKVRARQGRLAGRPLTRARRSASSC